MPTNDINDLLKNPEQIKQMIGLLSTLLEVAGQASPEATEDQDESSDTKAKTTTASKAKKTKKSFKPMQQKPQRENKFLSMPEAKMHKEDPELAQKLYKNPPTARTRKNTMIKAQCRICGKKETVQASLLYGGVERFKCNKCSTTPG